MTNDTERDRPRGRGGPRGPRGRRGGRRLEMMRRKLDLTDEQVATLQERLAEHRAQRVGIVRDVLDDEQRARFDRHLERRRFHHGRHHSRPETDSPTDGPTDGPTDVA